MTGPKHPLLILFFCSGDGDSFASAAFPRVFGLIFIILGSPPFFVMAQIHRFSLKKYRVLPLKIPTLSFRIPID